MKILYKVIIPILIVLMILGMMTKTHYAEGTTQKIGDINGDGVIDSRDTLKILEHIAASSISKIKNKHPDWILKNEIIKYADINGDGAIDSRDTLKLLEYIAASNITKIAQKNPNWIKYIESKWITEATNILVEPKNVTIDKGKTILLKATLIPSNTTNKLIKWSSSDSSIATVDGIGNVVAKSEGVAIITATTSNGKKAECSVKVIDNTEITIALSPTYSLLEKGKNIQLNAKTQPVNNKNMKITWSSNNTDIATVSQTGLVHAVKVGKAIITAKLENGKTATSQIVVNIPPKSLSFNSSSISLNKGVTDKITVNFNPVDTSSKEITWTTSNSNIVSVNSTKTTNGTVTITAKSAGTATITAKHKYGKTATCKVTVNDKVYYVSKSGSDSNNGTSPNSPLKTIGKGLSKLSAGYTLIVNEGTYYENGLVLSKNGTSSNPIKIISNGNVIVDGNGKKKLLSIRNASYIVIDGFTFQNLNQDDAKGILMEPKTENITIRNCKFSNIKTPHPKSEEDGSSAIFLNGSSSSNALSNIKIENCSLKNIQAGYSEAISVDGNCTKITITGVTVTYDSGFKGNIGICICGNYGTCSNKSIDRPRDVTISKCNVSNCKSPYDPGSAYGIYVDGGENVKIFENTVQNCEGGIEMGAEIKNSSLSGRETENIKTYNNIIKNCGIGAQIGGWDGKATVLNVLFDNNTLLNCGKDGGKGIELSKCKDVTISNNKFNTKQEKWFENSSMAKNVTKKNNVYTN